MSKEQAAEFAQAKKRMRTQDIQMQKDKAKLDAQASQLKAMDAKISGLMLQISQLPPTVLPPPPPQIAPPQRVRWPASAPAKVMMPTTQLQTSAPGDIDVTDDEEETYPGVETFEHGNKLGGTLTQCFTDRNHEYISTLADVALKMAKKLRIIV